MGEEDQLCVHVVEKAGGLLGWRQGKAAEDRLVERGRNLGKLGALLVFGVHVFRFRGAAPTCQT